MKFKHEDRISPLANHILYGWKTKEDKENIKKLFTGGEYEFRGQIYKIATDEEIAKIWEGGKYNGYKK